MEQTQPADDLALSGGGPPVRPIPRRLAGIPAIALLALAVWLGALSPRAVAQTLPGTLTVSPRGGVTNGTAWDFSYTEPGWPTTLTGIIHKPDGSGPFPGVVVSHGGGESGPTFAIPKAERWFGPAGYVSIGPTYTHSVLFDCATASPQTCGGSPENVLRAQRALDILVSGQLESLIGTPGATLVDPARLFLYGNSMGATVSIETSEVTTRPLAAVAITAGGLIVHQLYGNLTPSGASGVARMTAPFMQMHGRLDTIAFPAQAQALSDALDLAGKVHELAWFPQGDHNIHVNTEAPVMAFVLDWFNAYGDGSAPALASLAPTPAAAGDTLVLNGSNLGTNINGNSSIEVGGAGATPLSWTPGAVQTTVPSAASSGPAHVVVPLGPIDDPEVENPVIGGARSNDLAFTLSGPPPPPTGGLNGHWDGSLKIKVKGDQTIRGTASVDVVEDTGAATGTLDGLITVTTPSPGLTLAISGSFTLVSRFLTTGDFTLDDLMNQQYPQTFLEGKANKKSTTLKIKTIPDDTILTVFGLSGKAKKTKLTLTRPQP